MSITGTAGFRRMKQVHPTNKAYVVVEVWRGMAAGASCFKSASKAKAHLRRLAAKIDVDTDELQLFEVQIKS